MCKKLKINCVDKCRCTKLRYYDQKLFYFVVSAVVTDRSLALSTKPLNVRLLTLFTRSDWETENELSGEIWLGEFSQIIKKKKLTVESYHSIRTYDQQS